ncbi:hypothetical protein D0T12_01570 [Actinomadura spongiicola]|uniref:Uncharacterized protein n=1 Tax=Actinomadura spongiicola TaxID=2303421 RepID=A0A372GNM8_9ACTN|nr:hypothetical protein [Actinomadura spongiicola]RFS86974.1 hypothetical protein D0T12_01570 [Actinomadura spongiicola]
MLTSDARRTHYYARITARRRVRKATWKASGGDTARFAEITHGHLATGYLYYYDEPAPASRNVPSPSIWRRTAVTALCVTAFYWLLAALVFLLGWIGYL